jgi:nitroreductase/dihydropteridine reductase
MQLNHSLNQTVYPHTKEDSFETIISAARQFAGSFGLEPFKLVEIKAEQDRHKLLKLSEFKQFGGIQTSFLIYAVRPLISKQQLEIFIRDLSVKKNISRETLSQDRRLLENSINQKNAEGKDWAARQAEQSLQTLRARASILGLQVRVLEQVQDHSLQELLREGHQDWRILYIVGLNRSNSRVSAGN